MLQTEAPYVHVTAQQAEQLFRAREVACLQRKAAKLGLVLSPQPGDAVSEQPSVRRIFARIPLTIIKHLTQLLNLYLVLRYIFFRCDEKRIGKKRVMAMTPLSLLGQCRICASR